jgi:hypothetical protein
MLNKQDFLTAIEFLEECNEGTTMSLYCHTFRQLPYLRRLIYQYVGEPDRTDGYTYKYPEFIIQIDSVVSAETKGDLAEGFYISWFDDRDWAPEILTHERSPKYLWYEKMGFCDADVANWEAREGVISEN